MTTKQNVIFVIVITIAVFIPMQVVYGQEEVYGQTGIDPARPDAECTFTYNERLAIIDATCEGYPNEITLFLSHGYDIKGIEGNVIYMTKSGK
jgi:hypothetical protein